MSNCLVPKAATDIDAIEIGALYHKARESIVDSVKYLIECGKRLRDKRKSLQHGEWLPWLAANAEVLGMNVTSTPQRLMKLATKFGVDAEFDETEAIEWSRQIWGNTSAAQIEQARETYEGAIGDGCTTDELDALIQAGRKFRVIYADPPWSFKVYSGKGKQRSADRHYDTQSLDDIKTLPVAALADDDCALLLWCVMPEIPGALDVIRAWGFEYKTVGFTWVKQVSLENRNLFWGMGYWTRANAELCLLATKGSPNRQAKDVHQVVMSPVGEHSRKPDEVQSRIERLLPGPYLELYGRRACPGWTVWGNEITKSLFHQHIGEFAA